TAAFLVASTESTRRTFTAYGRTAATTPFATDLALYSTQVLRVHRHCAAISHTNCLFSFLARHERLDSLMGGDFQQFRSSVSCGQPNCPFANVNSSAGNKTSHFHCLKCPYVCADTNKVVAHRRQHGKMDSITANGFE